MKIATRCKGLLLGGLLCLSSWALALPSPKDIEASVQAGQLDRAESQLREVLREKPSSARAHYELSQVLAREGRYVEAEQALRQAQQLDPSLKFASSPQRFTDLLNKLEARNRSAPASAGALTSTAPAVSAASEAATPRQSPAQPTPGLPWGWLLLGGAALAGFALWMRRAATTQSIPARSSYSPAPAFAPLDPQGFGRGYGAAPPSYTGAGNAYPGVPAGTGGSGMGGSGMGSAVTGAVVGGIAGAAAGYALSKVLESDHHDAPHAASPDQDTGFTAFDSLPERPDLGAFDGGSGDSWDNADSDGGDSAGGDSSGW